MMLCQAPGVETAEPRCHPVTFLGLGHGIDILDPAAGLTCVREAPEHIIASINACEHGIP